MWYVLINDDQLGPMPESELRDLISNGVVDSDALVWAESMTDWVPLGDSPFAAAPADQMGHQVDDMPDDGTLVASPDDEALKAELAALFEQSQAPAPIAERPTALDGEQAAADDGEPATIAMPSFVPGADLLDDISPPKADELSMTMGVFSGDDQSDADGLDDAGESMKNPLRDSARDGDDGSSQNGQPESVDYAEIDESVLRQARSTVVGHGPERQPSIPLPAEPMAISDSMPRHGDTPELDAPQAKVIGRQTAVQDSRQQEASDPLTELEPAAPSAIHDARQIGRLQPAQKNRVPLAMGAVLVAVLGVATAAYFLNAEDKGQAPKTPPKAIKIGMSAQDVIKATQAKKAMAKPTVPVSDRAGPTPASQSSETGSTHSPGAGLPSGQAASPPPTAQKTAPVTSERKGAKSAPDKSTSSQKQVPRKSVIPVARKGLKNKEMTAVQRARAAQLELRRRQAALTKKKAQPKKQPAIAKKQSTKSNLFGGTRAKGNLPFSLNHKQITRALGKRRGRLKRCVGKDEQFKNAKVMVALTIKRNGRPANVRAISGSVRGTQVGRCIERAIAGIRFPRFSGDHMQLTVPIRL